MVALHLLRSPPLWALLPVLLGVVPLLQELRPLGTSTTGLEIARAWAFPAGLTGVSLALVHLSQREAFLVRVAPGVRALGEWGGCLLAPLSLQLPIILGALGSHPEALDLAHAATDILCSDLHLAGLALLSLALPISTHARLLAFLALAWALPALGAPHAALGRLVALLDAARPLGLASSALPAALAGLGLALLHALRRLPAPAPR
jgi:hypothetical protein